jgi:hypothetical protein
MKCSVLLCTYNPNLEVLNRVLDSLKNQSCPANLWGLIVIDNGSNERLSNLLNLSWHPNSKIIREDQPGKINALIRGFYESSSDLLITVDDDNVLDVEYIKYAVEIFENWHMLGAWGGSIKGEFEIPLPSWFRSNLSVIGVKEITRDYYGNSYTYLESIPIGAGMCIRRPVMQHYINLLNDQPIHRIFIRNRELYLGGEDSDIVYSALDIGYGIGRFKKLAINHIINTNRLTKEYFLKTYLGNITSFLVLKELREETKNIKLPRRLGVIKKIKFLIKYYRADKEARDLIRLNNQARINAIKILDLNKIVF